LQTLVFVVYALAVRKHRTAEGILFAESWEKIGDGVILL
jgi:hypothetical protein